MNLVLSKEQIQELTEGELTAAYDLAKTRLDGLLKDLEKNPAKKSRLQEPIMAARIQYIMLRFRRYPKHFSKLNTANNLANLSTPIGEATAL